MRLLLIILFFVSNLIAEQTYRLKDNETVIKGNKVAEDATTITVETKFGPITLQKSEVIQPKYQVKLKTGDMLTGVKDFENDTSIILKTSMGSLTLPKSDIEYMNEVGKTTVNSTSSSNTSSSSFYDE